MYENKLKMFDFFRKKVQNLLILPTYKFVIIFVESI